MAEDKFIGELMNRLVKLPKVDRGIKWESRNYRGEGQLICYGDMASLFKWILDHTDDLISSLFTANATIAADRQWRCFHCEEVFTEREEARLHFGDTECSDPACKLKAGAEMSLLKALRETERDAANAWEAIHSESTEAHKAYHAQAARHREQLTAAEELGYERGLRDAREEAAERNQPAPGGMA